MQRAVTTPFNQVFDDHFDAVYSYVAYRIAPDIESAKDVTQEVFLGAFKGYSRFRGEGSVLGWLRGIARRKVADYFEAQRRAGKESRQMAEGDLLTASIENSESQEQALQVSLVMRQLPDGYAELLEHKYLDRLSVRAMAQRHGISEKAIESRLSRAREAFRKHFQIIKSDFIRGARP